MLNKIASTKNSAYKNNRAQATLEFALILPVFLILAMLLLQLGLVVKTKILLVHSTREATRAVLALSSTSDSTFSREFSLKEARAVAQQAVFESTGLDTAKTQVSVRWVKPNLLEVEVSYRATLLAIKPILGNFAPDLNLISQLRVLIPLSS